MSLEEAVCVATEVKFRGIKLIFFPRNSEKLQVRFGDIVFLHKRPTVLGVLAFFNILSDFHPLIAGHFSGSTIYKLQWNHDC